MSAMSLRSYRFVQVDVFTDRVFGGNPLAVFFDGRGLDDALMQQIAREMNLSETVFLFPPSRPDCAAALRIFTPARELPFAGHPTVGTAWVLAAHGMAPKGASRFVLEEKVGPIPVELDGDPARPDFVWMKHPEATFDPVLENRGALARALGLEEADLLPGAPIRPGSTGNTFLFVPLRDRRRWTAPSSTSARSSGPWATCRSLAFSCSRPIRIPRRGASTRACSRHTPPAFPRTRRRALPAGRSAPISC